ncbi:DUF3131 domain-containing protein [Pseudodesulfovibrio sp. JC047]|uniref:DUF3131 domain-containing protein n=1 Tax=Pseudodesulfovibrio sp. JC047 TaxID=2683199 RepID=UPI0013D1BF6A|nr:DUF3131 domain-containing protein [Pseudodesulfovibrio sp. JC047]NDV19259.1 DUF3131 domain-containing protein [Pseudodesulfovibrio sp. JC047]
MIQRCRLLLIFPLIVLILACSTAWSAPISPAREPVPRQGPLTKQEQQWARIAWSYFQANVNEETGLAGAQPNYAPFTMWDISAHIAAIISAYQLGLIEEKEFDGRIRKILKWFTNMDLFRGDLPNQFYSADNGQMVDWANQPGELGWSALDLGRLLTWLKILKEKYPVYGELVDKGVMRWNWTKLMDREGTMFGASYYQRDPNNLIHYAEGRLGYEEYAARGFLLWGANTDAASAVDPYSTITVYGFPIPFDAREPENLHAPNFVVSESYVLDGIEHNWDVPGDTNTNVTLHSDPIQAEFAWRIYKAQEARFLNTGILTARTEDAVDKPPYFVYGTILGYGTPWATLSHEGKSMPELACLNTKAALGLWVLFKSDYTDLLAEAVSALYEPDKGFYVGRFEETGMLNKSITLNGNGVIMEILLYKATGKLLTYSGKESYWDLFFKTNSLPKKALPPWKYQPFITIHKFDP